MGTLTGQIIKGTGSYEVKEIAPISNFGELFKDPGFDTGTGWTLGTSWSIGDSLATYDGIGFANVLSPNYLTPVGIWAIVKFTIASGTARMLIADPGGTLVATANYSPGTYQFIVKTTGNVIRFTAYNNLGGTAFSMSDASFTEVPEGYPLMDKGMKYLECTSSGTAAFKSDMAYGEWEFDLYKYADGALSIVSIIANKIASYPNVQSYSFQFSSSEAIRLYDYNDASATLILGSAGSYFSLGTWYRVKITRTLDGEFSVYIKGGGFGIDEWALVSVVGGSGSNPVIDTSYLESKVLVIDIDTGDRIANITMKKAVKQ